MTTGPHVLCSAAKSKFPKVGLTSAQLTAAVSQNMKLFSRIRMRYLIKVENLPSSASECMSGFNCGCNVFGLRMLCGLMEKLLTDSLTYGHTL